MKRLQLSIVILAILAATQTFAQSSDQISITDVKGTPLPMGREFNIEGSPFYSNDYCKADIKIANGKSYEGVLIKLNLQDNSVYFKMADQKEMVATVPVQYIMFTGGCGSAGAQKVFQSGFPEIDGQSEKNFYEVLSGGNILLLKHQAVTYRDNTPYGSTAIVRMYEKKMTYYAYSPAKGILKLNDSDAAVKILANHAKEVKNFIATNNIRMKKEEDLVKLVSFYNSL